MINAGAWAAYKAKFLDATGRIIDNGNGNISHSEGQGYGMLLAYLSASPADFEQIWYFTRTELLLRDDGLAVWKWDPNVKPHVTDTNNASDGDMLIAYALALAGTAWKRTTISSLPPAWRRRCLPKPLCTRPATHFCCRGARDLPLPTVRTVPSSTRPTGFTRRSR